MADPLQSYTWATPQSKMNMGAPDPRAQASPTSSTGSTIDQLLASLYHPPSTGEKVADLGSVLGGLSSGEKANRMVSGELPPEP
jgi:hypothetical protein